MHTPDPYKGPHLREHTCEAPAYVRIPLYCQGSVPLFLMYTSGPLSHRQYVQSQGSHLPGTPGIADGSTMRNTVRSFPAPSPKLPSRYESGTAFSASSVVLMIKGSIMIAMVNARPEGKIPIPEYLQRTAYRRGRTR